MRRNANLCVTRANSPDVTLGHPLSPRDTHPHHHSKLLEKWVKAKPLKQHRKEPLPCTLCYMNQKAFCLSSPSLGWPFNNRQDADQSLQHATQLCWASSFHSCLSKSVFNSLLKAQIRPATANVEFSLTEKIAPFPFLFGCLKQGLVCSRLTSHLLCSQG